MAAVGRGRDTATDTLFADYARRCAWPMRLVEVQARDSVPPDRRKAAEAELLLAAVPAGAALAVLDERGRDLTSPEHLNNKMQIFSCLSSPTRLYMSQKRAIEVL